MEGEGEITAIKKINVKYKKSIISKNRRINSRLQDTSFNLWQNCHMQSLMIMFSTPHRFHFLPESDIGEIFVMKALTGGQTCHQKIYRAW